MFQVLQMCQFLQLSFILDFSVLAKLMGSLSIQSEGGAGI